MNVKNNRRQRDTDERIIRAVYEMLVIEKRPVASVTVTEVCERVGMHRSTFYAHYQDVFDVMESVEAHMADDLTESFLSELDHHSSAEACFIKLFEFIKTYQEFYLFYLDEARKSGAIQVAWEKIQSRYGEKARKNLGIKSEERMQYHGVYMLFGMTAIIRLWLKGGCRETPQELYEILREHGRVVMKMTSW